MSRLNPETYKTNCSNCGEVLMRTRRRALKGKCYCNARCQMDYEYSNGIRNRKAITLKANESMRKNGNPKLRGKPCNWLKSPKYDEIRKKISVGKTGIKNPMFGKTPWNYIDGTSNKYGGEWDRLRRLVLHRDEYKCVKCGLTNEESINRWKQGLHVDHIIPYKVTKRNDLENLQSLCLRCHQGKFKLDWIYIKNSTPSSISSEV